MDWQENSTTTTELNQYFLRAALWPAVLYTTLLMFVGTVGNLLVLMVYRRHFQRSVTRMFIYTLAILDLGNCLITMPAELAILIMFTSFPSPFWCKVTRYLTYIFNGTSSIVLIAIALDRFYKVCRPMKVLITVRRARIICVASFGLTAILSLPALIMYGDLTLPIKLSNGRWSIQPMTLDYSNSSNFPRSFATSITRSVSESVKLVTVSDGIQIEPNIVVNGHFCLLDSGHINGKMPLLFYSSMFAMYIVMVILLVVFYGNVARTMFVLTSKHSKLFSFNTHKSVTPSSNSNVPESSGGHCQRNAPQVDAEVSSANIKTKGSNSPSMCPNNIFEEGTTVHANAKPPGQFINEHNNRTVLESSQQGNACETGYETGGTSTSSETRIGVASQCPRTMSSNKILTGNCDQEREIGSCSIMFQLENNTEKSVNNSTGSAEINSCQENIKPQILADETSTGLLERKDKKHSRNSKIPKIKVQKTRTKDYNLDNSTHDLHPHHLDLAFYPTPINSLLRRRIKSEENVNHLSRLYLLQVPEGRARCLRFPDIMGSKNPNIRHKHSSHRENRAACGVVTTSSINLNYIIDGSNSSLNQEKTLTLTKMSSNGKKRRCVLPLTGMITRTASQVRDHHVALHVRDGQATSDQSIDSSKSGGFYRSDSSLNVSHGCGEARGVTTRSTPADLNSPELDSIITLRNRTPDIGKHGTPSEDNIKKGKVFHVQIKTSRKQIVSAADILQEQHTRRGSLHPFRTSRMLFIISLVFVLSFLPFFVIALARSVIGSPFMSMSESSLSILSVLIRSSLLSNAINPIAYGCLSTHFRRECAGIMCCIFRRKHATL